jgi:hypothetical protein
VKLGLKLPWHEPCRTTDEMSVMASFIFIRLFIYFIKPTSHPCHKWNIIDEEEPTHEQMKHMGILWI